ncbi:uncharacterized protein LOC103571697 [Microplitis demolitor]|uniref:uncharacterized protein LOC103571697 n=1 Tax=Microplitis demolitor TaxID=69319 RepID=UPI0004CD56EA|nr:uncharacterized protein LOC103571697 [Microplitis demolitor]
MKFVLIGLLVALLYVEAQSFVSRPGTGVPRPPINYPIPPFNPGPPRWPSGYRFRRSPQGEVSASVIKPEHGRPQMNMDYNQNIFSDDNSKLSAHGGVSSPDFKHFTPNAGVNYEWNPNKDTYLRAQTEFQKSPTGRMEPSFGAQFGMRFRRSPQGSVDASLSKSEHGQPQMNLDYNQNIFSDDNSKLSTHGGVSSSDFSHFTPNAGVNYEWNPNKDTYLRAQTEFQKSPTGRMEPSFGAQFGMRWRREIEGQEE